MNNWKSGLMVMLLAGLLYGCGFHLRGQSSGFEFPYRSVYIDCGSVIICPGFKSTVIHEHLASIVTNHESAEATIVVANEQTSRDALDYNSTGQIASFILTYQITARVYNPKGTQIGADIVVKNQMVMMYNNSLILSATQQEETTWDQVHQNVINALVRRIVYSHPLLMTPVHATESN